MATGFRSNGRPFDNLAALQNASEFYGGSTTFGYGVAGFFSAPKNPLLVQSLRLGHRPAAVVFLDGTNESFEVVVGQKTLGPNLEKLLDGYRWGPIEIAKPVLYVAAKLGDRLKSLVGREPEPRSGNELLCDRPEGPQALRAVHARLLAEQDVVCRLYEPHCTTFVQPFAGARTP